MKTVVEAGTNLSKYVFDNATDLIVSGDNIATPLLIIGDLNSSNATVHDGVTPPEDWVGNKYTFDGASWTANPDWSEPVVEEEV
jgi:hypothetical protein